MTDNVIPIGARRKDVLLKVGGPVDKTRVSLCIYGEQLNPDDITEQLDIEPTTSFRKGSRKGPKRPPVKHGGWFLELQGGSPHDPESLTSELLSRLPKDRSVLKRLSKDYDVQVRFGIFLNARNRGFDLSPELVSEIAATGAKVVFDIYFDLEEES